MSKKIKRKVDNVAIVGFSPHQNHYVGELFSKPNWEFWGLNDLNVSFPEMQYHATRWFQVHEPEYLIYQRKWTEERFEWFKLLKIPIYMIKHYPEIPMSVEYPLQKILKEFGRYFNNSFCWMIALAIQEGFKRIHLYGCDMAEQREYERERPGVEYYVGLARGKGINVFIPAESDLMKCHVLYGFEQDDTFDKNVVLKKINYKRGADEAREELHECDLRLNRRDTLIEYIKHNTFFGDEVTIEQLEKELEEVKSVRNRMFAKYYGLQGAYDTMDLIERTWMHKLPLRDEECTEIKPF